MIQYTGTERLDLGSAKPATYRKNYKPKLKRKKGQSRKKWVKTYTGQKTLAKLDASKTKWTPKDSYSLILAANKLLKNKK